MTNNYQLNVYSELSSIPVPCFLPRLPKGLRGQTNTHKRKLPVLFTANDHKGTVCHITQVRPTRHGFEVLYGYADTQIFGLGPERLIATPELVDFWEKNRTGSEALIYDLPVGRTTIKRARKRLGFNFRIDSSKFWMDRFEDLKTMSKGEFAAKHGVKPAVVRDTRRRLIGNVARPVGWWNKPAILEYLRSGVTLAEICAKFGVKYSQACRLRTMAQQHGGSKIAAKTPVTTAEGWWRTPKIIGILLSGKPVNEIASKLGVNNRQASRLRGSAQRIYGDGGEV